MTEEFQQVLVLRETALPWKAEQAFEITALLYPIPLALCISSSLCNSVHGRPSSPKSSQQVAAVELLCILHQAGVFGWRPKN